MKKSQSLILFHQNTVRRHWDGDKELWYFSIMDIVQVIHDDEEARACVARPQPSKGLADLDDLKRNFPIVKNDIQTALAKGYKIQQWIIEQLKREVDAQK